MRKFRDEVESTAKFQKLGERIGTVVAYTFFAAMMNFIMYEFIPGFDNYWSTKNIVVAYAIVWPVDKFFQPMGIRLLLTVFIGTMAYHFTK